MCLLKVGNLSKAFRIDSGFLRRRPIWHQAVDDVSFDIRRSETFAIVGESGAGKSTVARLLPRLIEADGGSIRFDDLDVLGLSGSGVRKLRSRLQMIFQDPYGCLDPRMPIGMSIAEPMVVHGTTDEPGRERRVRSLLERVGLRPADGARLPSEFSGGQLQRIAIARALSIDPELIICDEPVTALDVSVRAQILNLMRELQAEQGISYLFISHDLSIVEAIADRIAIMLEGRIVEMGSRSQVFASPRDDYTKELLASIPTAVPKAKG